MKIYSDDPAVPYKSTDVDPRTTKAEIEGLLARWGIKKSGWDWDLENGKCVLEFQYVEIIQNVPVSQWVRLEPPQIFNHARKDQHSHKVVGGESINWKVSLRVLYWWLKCHLEMTYLSKYDKSAMLLPFIETGAGKTVAETLVPKMVNQIAPAPSLEDLRK